MTTQAQRQASTDGAIPPVSRNAALGWSGLVFIGVTVFLAVGAVNSQNNLLFWIFGIAVAGVVVSGVVSGSGLMGVRLRVHPPEYFESDAPGKITYTVYNTNPRLPVFGLVLRETNLDTKSASGAFVQHLPPGESVRVTLDWTPDRRGVFELDQVVAESRFPFGLLAKTLTFSAPRRAIVRPSRLELSAGVSRASRPGDSGRPSRRAKRGSTGSFFGLREYAPGDPRRTIAWKPTAKRDQLLVVEHAQPKRRSVWVWIPKPGESADSDLNKERAIAIAAAIGDHAPGPVGIWIPWAGVRIEPTDGRIGSQRIRDALALVSSGDAEGNDRPPPVAMGEEIITVAGSGVRLGSDSPSTNRIDPAAPATWLSRGATLPASLLEREAEDG